MTRRDCSFCDGRGYTRAAGIEKYPVCEMCNGTGINSNYNVEGPKLTVMKDCRDCRWCWLDYDPMEGWVEMICIHGLVFPLTREEKRERLIGYLDKRFQFPTKFECPVEEDI